MANASGGKLRLTQHRWPPLCLMCIKSRPMPYKGRAHLTMNKENGYGRLDF